MNLNRRSQEQHSEAVSKQVALALALEQLDLQIDTDLVQELAGAVEVLPLQAGKGAPLNIAEPLAALQIVAGFAQA